MKLGDCVLRVLCVLPLPLNMTRDVIWLIGNEFGMDNGPGFRKP